MPKAKFYIGYMIVACMIISCSKNKSYDVKGDPEVKFFTNNTGWGNAPENSISYGLVNVPDAAGPGWINLSTTLPDTIKFPVFATHPVGSDVVIGAALDNSLIAQYNAAHNTSFAAFPDGILKATALQARLVKGGSRSVDSITIPLDKVTLSTLTQKAYMAPIRLTTVSDPDAGAITSNTVTQVMYIVVTTELRRIKYLATTTDVQGALITPRTGWTVTLTPTPGIVGSVVDGVTSTYSRWSSSPGQVDVDMAVSKNVTGIRLFTTTSTSSIPTQVEVSLSTDGINYDVIGAPLRANLTLASSYNYILFYKAIQARYVRVKLYYSTSTSSNNLRLAEFDVYAN